MMYWDEIENHALILQYLLLPPETRRLINPGKAIREKIILNCDKIIRAIIVTYRFYKWDSFENCESIAREACMKSIDKFDPGYVTKKGTLVSLFNYFSLVAKRSIMFETKHDCLNRYASEIIENIYHDSPEQDTEEAIQNIFQNLDKITVSKKKLVILLKDFLLEYGSFNRRSFMRVARGVGYSGHMCRAFLTELSNQKDIFYDQVQYDSPKILAGRDVNYSTLIIES